MKNSIKFVVFLTILRFGLPAYSQSMEDFFYLKGVKGLSELAHPSNQFVEGTYDVQNDYVKIIIKSKDSITGFIMQTDMYLKKEAGKLYFSDIIVTRDDDKWSKTFSAYKLMMDLIIETIKAMNPEQVNQMVQEINRSFNTNIAQWDGKIWALLAINAGYYEYLIKRK
jgi:hypothetical protein